MMSSLNLTSPGGLGEAPVIAERSFPVAHERSFKNHIVGGIALLILAGALYGLAANDNFKWSVFADYVVSGPILKGLLVTLELSAFSLALGLILGTFVALGRRSKNPVIANTSAFYVWLLRGLPAIVQLLFWGNLGLFIPSITVQVPFTDIVLGQFRLSQYLTPFIASFVALGLASSAYMGEIIRGGIQSVESGQREAAAALGMRSARIMRRIIIPQAMRAIVPSLANEFSNIVKASALVSVIAGGDLLTTAQNIAGQNYRVMELLFVASFWYLVILAIMTPVQSAIEARARRMDRV